MGAKWEKMFCDCWPLFRLFVWEICLTNRFKSSGESQYSDQLWSNNILVLLFEGPKPNTSMIVGFPTPGAPLIMDFIIPKVLSEK